MLYVEEFSHRVPVGSPLPRGQWGPLATGYPCGPLANTSLTMDEVSYSRGFLMLVPYRGWGLYVWSVMLVCVAVCQSVRQYRYVCLSVCKVVCLSVCLTVSQCVRQYVFQCLIQYVCQSVRQCVCLSVCKTIYLSACLWGSLSRSILDSQSVRLSVYQWILLAVCLPVIYAAVYLSVSL